MTVRCWIPEGKSRIL